MQVIGDSGRLHRSILVVASPLRRVDPRTKLALSICASLSVMLPLPRMLAFVLFYATFLLGVRLLGVAVRQVWQLKWLLIVLFVMDGLFIGADLAVIITLRLVLLVSVFALVVNTTTPEELRLALERLGVPDRYAFSLSLAFQSVDLLRSEWRMIREAQMARGAWVPIRGRWRNLTTGLRDMVMLTVPAIVLTTRRAWAMTEAASMRGFEAPHRRPYRVLGMRIVDWLLIGGALVVVGGLGLL